MPYDAATQTHEPVMLDGEELKIGDEVIVARQPADPDNDDLWSSGMSRLVGCRGIVCLHSDTPTADTLSLGAPVVVVRVGGNQWWRCNGRRYVLRIDAHRLHHRHQQLHCRQRHHLHDRR